jgi:hypothetical protein
MNDKGLKSLLFTELDSYQDFVNNYFSTFLFNIFAYRVNILLSEEKDKTLDGLSDFISRFVPEYFKTYQETTKKMKFNSIIN